MSIRYNTINWKNPMQLARTKAVYTFINRYYTENGYGPSFRKMKDVAGGNLENVGHHVRRLEEQGHITLSRFPGGNLIPHSIIPKVLGKQLLFSDEEWHLMHAAWGDDIKEEILEAAGQTRFVVTSPGEIGR